MSARKKGAGPAWVVQLQPGPHPLWIAKEGGLGVTRHESDACRFESQKDAEVALQGAEAQCEFPLAEVYRRVSKPSATGALLCAELEGDIAPNVEVRDVQLNAEIQPAHDTALCSCGAPLQPALYADGTTRPLDVPKFSDCRVDWWLMRCVSSGDEFAVNPTRALHAWWSAGAHEQKLWMQRQAVPR